MILTSNIAKVMLLVKKVLFNGMAMPVVLLIKSWLSAIYVDYITLFHFVQEMFVCYRNGSQLLLQYLKKAK
jgi:hypothetical protein